MNIYPTGKCFDDAVEILEAIVRACPEAADGDEYLLVHAICRNPASGERFAHAWVETGGGHGVAVFRGIIDGKRLEIARPVAKHYAELQPTNVTKYTPLEMVEQNQKWGTYGPWQMRYIKLCRPKKKAKGKRGSGR